MLAAARGPRDAWRLGMSVQEQRAAMPKPSRTGEHGSPSTERVASGGGPDVLRAMHRSLGNAAVAQLLRDRMDNERPSGAVQRVVVQRLVTAEGFARQYAPASKSDDTLTTIVEASR